MKIGGVCGDGKGLRDPLSSCGTESNISLYILFKKKKIYIYIYIAWNYFFKIIFLVL